MFTKFFAAVLTFSILAANPVFCARRSDLH